jgi:hypothetical protein
MLLPYSTLNINKAAEENLAHLGPGTFFIGICMPTKLSRLQADRIQLQQATSKHAAPHPNRSHLRGREVPFIEASSNKSPSIQAD